MFEFMEVRIPTVCPRSREAARPEARIRLSGDLPFPGPAAVELLLLPRGLSSVPPEEPPADAAAWTQSSLKGSTPRARSGMYTAFCYTFSTIF